MFTIVISLRLDCIDWTYVPHQPAFGAVEQQLLTFSIICGTATLSLLSGQREMVSFPLLWVCPIFYILRILLHTALEI